MINEERYPLNGTFELTGRCNLSCKMCLVRIGQQQICESGMREKTAREWIDMAEQARDAGTFSLLLTGGEVMLRPDFCEIYEAISKMGFILTVYTNATMVTDEIMGMLKKHPPHKIGVTMYGASNETYAEMCGCADGYDRFVEGVRKLSTLPSLLGTRTTIIKDNLKDLSAMKEFTRREFGEDKTLTVSRFVADKIRGGVAHPKSCRLSPEENVELIHNKIAALSHEVQKGAITLTKITEKFQVQHGVRQAEGRYIFEQCGAGINSYAISWDGKMFACELLDRGYTEPFDIGFDKAWEYLPEQYPLTKNIQACSECEVAGLCEVCPATRLAETGDWFGVPEYSCGEARETYQLLEKMKIV